MEDIASKLSQLLSNPDIMKQIKSLSEADVFQENADIKQNTVENSSHSLNDIPPDTLNTIMKLAPVLSSMNNDDKYTSFLQALRPLLSEAKQKRLDESSKLIKLLHVLPILKNNGII